MLIYDFRNRLEGSSGTILLEFERKTTESPTVGLGAARRRGRKRGQRGMGGLFESRQVMSSTKVDKQQHGGRGGQGSGKARDSPMLPLKAQVGLWPASERRTGRRHIK